MKKITVEMKYPEFGRGWYGVSFPEVEVMTDAEIVARINSEWIDATAIRIGRYYDGASAGTDERAAKAKVAK